MNKKTARILGLLILTVVMVTAFSGCDLIMALFGGKIVARIESFESDLNKSDRSNIYRNFHPDMGDYGAVQTDAFWDSSFSTDYSYAFESIDADDDGLTATATFKVTGYGSTYPYSVSFVFRESGSDVLIFSFTGFDEEIFQILGTTPVTRE